MAKLSVDVSVKDTDAWAMVMALLRRVEFSATRPSDLSGICPECRSEDHKEDCELDRFLKAWES